MVLEKTLESPLDCEEIQPVHPRSVVGIHWKDWCWSWNSSTLATSCEELTHWKRPWYWEGLGAGGEGDDRGWDGWMTSPTWWAWVWVNSRSWWWTRRPGVLRFMGSQRVRQTELLNWTDWGLIKVEKGDGAFMMATRACVNDDSYENANWFRSFPGYVWNNRKQFKKRKKWERKFRNEETISSFYFSVNPLHMQSESI